MKNNGFIKENKGKIIISSILILLPIIAGIILWNRLPDTMAIHWGITNEADGFGSKPMAVFFLPLFMLIIHILCLIATSFDKNISNISKKALGIVFWICPVASIVSSIIIYSTAVGHTIDVGMWIFILLGIVLCITGNYMPKVKQNHVFGVKVPWVYKSEENWNKTHRFAGITYFIAGILLILYSLIFNEKYINYILIIIIFLAISPIFYSYAYYLKYEKNR